MVKIDQMLRNREAQAKPAKLPGHRSISLLKRPEQRSQPLRFNSNAVVSNVETESATLIVVGADGDLSTGWREFHRVVDQVPKDLLKPDAISQDAMFFRVQFGREFQLLRRNGGTCGFNCVANNRGRVATFQIEVKFAASDPGRSRRSSINRACNCTLRLISCTPSANSGGSFAAFSSKWVAAARAGVSGVRSSWLSAAKVILSLACFLGRDFFRFKFPAANLIGDVARDFGLSPNIAVGVPHGR